ncbi:snare associated Golgi protein-domain-containing protein [Irpex rosettiformis]|uniref:Snare associated Golgi protein-domain-containing protein n=1 Tax=Irpex rosettiformis TaxID=378272 RepID=A0ACB8UCD7_9APHY|nr:snare associated Golgi protein-domain-containing protein [Irpex rosettiformis]
MATLTPPSNRHRASSTSFRPPLTLNSCSSRKRSNSDLAVSALSPAHSYLAKATFADFYMRFMDLLHITHKDSTFSSAPSSPRQSRSSFSDEDSILPISSPVVATFGDAVAEKQTAKSTSWWQGSPSVHTPVFFVIALLPVSTALLLFCMSTLPITNSWPRNLTDLAQLGRELHGYSQSGWGPMSRVVGVLSVVVVWNHAWSIPGSVLWNVLAGALFSPWLATLLLTVLTTLGSICASLLSAPLAPFLVKMFPRALDMTRNAIEGATSDEEPKSAAWVRLSILRLIGIVPWSGINVACGVCGVAMKDCSLGAFIGSMPWTAVTCQIGDILQTVASTPSPNQQTVQDLLTSPQILIKLVFLTILSLAPILGRQRLSAWVSSSTSASVKAEMAALDTKDDRVSRWAWVKDWRDRIRAPSRSRVRDAIKEELSVLRDEKNANLPI